jgi:HSP90 family molecular chaperone
MPLNTLERLVILSAKPFLVSCLIDQGKTSTMQKGQIRVQTENIFPIIKKFLYSDHEIFLRELVSNAVDASQKLKTLSSLGEAKGDLGDLRIDVVLDAKEKTLSIIDNGVGMTSNEVDKYINQVAFSGAEEFMEKYKDANIIGHFGLGFYSSFMVSDKVELFSKSHKENLNYTMLTIITEVQKLYCISTKKAKNFWKRAESDLS